MAETPSVPPQSPPPPRPVRRRRSLFFPILLIAVGVIFLLDNMRLLPGNIWENLIQYWPVLLIVLGLDSIFKREGLVGPVLFIGLGVIFLLANFGYLGINVWDLVLKLWPILLVAIGLDIVVARRSTAGAIISLIIIVVLILGGIWLFSGAFTTGQPLVGDQINQSLSGAAQVKASIEPAAGTLRLKAAAQPGGGITGVVTTGAGMRAVQNYSLDGDTANFTIRTSGQNVTWTGFNANLLIWEVSLPPQLPIDLRTSMGAGETQLDLQGLNISHLEVRIGAGKIQITLPATGRFDGSVDGAVGQITITIPPGMAVRITANTALVNVDVPASFSRSNKVYTSPDFGSSANRADLVVGQAIGSVVIEMGK